MLSRRHFAKSLGAAACLLPFLREGRAVAATTPARRLLIVHSMPGNTKYWRPTSAAGQPIAFGQGMAPLQAIADSIVMLDGLSLGNPEENHGSPAALTGRGFDGQKWLSVDQYIAQKLQLPAPLLLGVLATGYSKFMNYNISGAVYNAVETQDDPAKVFKALFGASTPAADASSTTAGFQTKSILDLVTAQLKSVRAQVGSDQQKKLDQHLQAVAKLESGASGPAATAGCPKPTAPNLMGLNPSNDAASLAVGDAQASLAVGALACGISQVVGLQWGTTQDMYLSGSINMNEHSVVHTSGQGANVITCENYIASWFVKLVGALKAAPDPFVANKSLLDTTLVLWTRDFGHQGPNDADDVAHTSFSMPYVLAGATDYLKTSPGGLYVNMGGDNFAKQRGQPHERLLYNLVEAMGVTDLQDTSFGSLPAAQRLPLAEIKK